jgi:hypothetical protein
MKYILMIVMTHIIIFKLKNKKQQININKHKKVIKPMLLLYDIY